MMRLLGTFYCLLSLLLADAKHSSDVGATYQVKPPNVLFLVSLFQKNDPHNVQSAQTDPNILLLYSDNIHSERWDKAAIIRTARGMNSESSPDLSTGDENPQPYNLIDMLLRPRRRLSPTHGNVPVPSMWLHPPPAIESPQNQQARSEASDTIASTSNEKVESGEDDSETPPPPSTIMAIPDLLLDLGYMLTQPLWVDKSKNRESHDFGMIAKAPFIICPLGFQRDLLGNWLFGDPRTGKVLLGSTFLPTLSPNRKLPASVPQQKRFCHQSHPLITGQEEKQRCGPTFRIDSVARRRQRWSWTGSILDYDDYANDQCLNKTLARR